MHGIIFKEMQRYVSKRFGLAAWYALLKEAALDHTIYMPTQHYPDQEIITLVSLVSALSGSSAETTLEEFGEFLAPNLLQLYGSMIHPGWKTLDLVEHTEKTMHRVVRFVDQSSAPPRLICTRTGPTEVVLQYASPRNMSSLGIGIIRGIARYYGECVSITRTYTSPEEARGSCCITVQLLVP